MLAQRCPLHVAIFPDPLTHDKNQSTHLSILLLIRRLHTFTGKLSLLADGYKSGTQPLRNDRSEQESARIQTDDDVDLAASERSCDGAGGGEGAGSCGWCGGRCGGAEGGQGVREEVVRDVSHESFEGERVPEEREDIAEGHALLWEVGVVSWL